MTYGSPNMNQPLNQVFDNYLCNTKTSLAQFASHDNKMSICKCSKIIYFA